MPSYPLTNVEIQKYDQNKRKFDSIHFRNNLRGSGNEGVGIGNKS